MSLIRGTYLEPTHLLRPRSRTVAEIQRKIIKQSQRDRISPFIHSKNDKDMIAGWKLGLNRILVVFNVRIVSLRLAAADFSPLRPNSL